MPDTNIDVRKLILATAEYERVRAIDPEAADYMDGPARELRSFMAWLQRTPHTECGRLNWAFYWDDTPQGRDYWADICTRLHPSWRLAQQPLDPSPT